MVSLRSLSFCVVMVTSQDVLSGSASEKHGSTHKNYTVQYTHDSATE